MTEIPLEWPQNYYKETDPVKRKELLEVQLSNPDHGREEELRKMLWEFRYEYREKEKNYADSFIRAWMEMIFESGLLKSRTGGKRRRKVMDASYQALHLDFPKEYGAMGEEVLHQELYQLLHFIVEIDLRDRSYGNLLLGMGRATEEHLVKKITRDFDRVCIQLPELIGEQEKFKLFTEVGKQVYKDCFPDEEEL